MVYYKDFIKKFEQKEIKEFILLFQDDEFTIDFNKPKANERARKLAKALKDKTTNIFIHKALDLIYGFPSKILYKINKSTDYKEIKDLKLI